MTGLRRALVPLFTASSGISRSVPGNRTYLNLIENDMTVAHSLLINYLVIAVILFGSMSGCTKVTKQESENRAPFAKQTIALTGMLEFTLKDEQLLYGVQADHQAHQQLAKIVELKDDGIREGRLTFVVWSRAYQEMVSGKLDPTEWFDISESGSLLFGVAKHATGI